ncbi:unnamed protein product, partial [Gadus morhua 'NCC']
GFHHPGAPQMEPLPERPDGSVPHERFASPRSCTPRELCSEVICAASAVIMELDALRGAEPEAPSGGEPEAPSRGAEPEAPSRGRSQGASGGAPGGFNK